MKRKLFTVITLTLCVLLAALSLAACGGKKADDNGGAASALLGTWNANEAEGCAYIFNEDGKGVWDAGDGVTMNFTYTDKGDSVEITYEGSSSTQTWMYTINGSDLTMTDKDSGSFLTYTKK